MKTYTKINTLYKRYKIDTNDIPEKKWMAMTNKIILGDFSNPWASYLWDCKFDCFSKIDGTNTRLIWFPGEKKLLIQGKSDDTDHSQFGLQDFFPQEERNRLISIFESLWPDPKFSQTLDKETKLPIYYNNETPILRPNNSGFYTTEFIEEPVYVFGEYYGNGIGHAGKHYGEKQFRVFDICDRGWWYPTQKMMETAKTLGFDIAPYIGQLSLREAEEKVKVGFKTLVPGVSNSELIEEGIVARPVVPLFDEHKNRIIIKIKVKDYKDLERAITAIGGESEYEKFKTWYNDRG